MVRFILATPLNKPFLHIFREAFIALAAPIRRATSTVDNVSERWGPFILNDINPLSSLHDAFFEKCKRPSCIDMPLQYALRFSRLVFSSNGCVAEHKRIVELVIFDRKLTISLNRLIVFIGNDCISSKMMTLSAILWNFRSLVPRADMTVSRNGSARKVTHFGSWPSMER